MKITYHIQKKNCYTKSNTINDKISNSKCALANESKKKELTHKNTYGLIGKTTILKLKQKKLNFLEIGMFFDKQNLPNEKKCIFTYALIF